VDLIKEKTMTRRTLVLAVTLAAALLPTLAFAKEKKAAEAPKCPACSMTLSTKKDKDHPKAVKIKGKTYYCCAKCDMDTKKKEGKKKEDEKKEKK
jgi:hypothetical protein